MDGEAWSIRKSWAHHEAGHVVAAHLLGHRVVRCEISPVEGEGAWTETEHDGDPRETALVAQAGPAAQIAFDELHGITGVDWAGHRAGLNDHDVQASMDAIRTWLPDPDLGPRREAFHASEQEARDLISTIEALRLIERVAAALDKESVLDEDRLRELLQQNTGASDFSR